MIHVETLNVRLKSSSETKSALTTEEKGYSRSRKIGKEGLVNGAGWKCAVRNFINCRTLQNL